MEPSQAPSPPTEPPRVLLIDLDNCPQQLAQLPENLAGFDRIVVCYGSQEPKLPLSLVTALAEPIMGGRLEIVGMEQSGKNAADFGLCFHAGKLMAEMPPETEFILLSEDGDLDHTVNLLRAHQRSARRMNGRTGKQASPLEDAAVASAARDYRAQRLLPGNTRPGSRKSLLKGIGSFTRMRYRVEPQAVLDWLQAHAGVSIDKDGAAYYREDLLEPLIAQDHFDDDIPF